MQTIGNSTPFRVIVEPLRAESQTRTVRRFHPVGTRSRLEIASFASWGHGNHRSCRCEREQLRPAKGTIPPRVRDGCARRLPSRSQRMMRISLPQLGRVNGRISYMHANNIAHRERTCASDGGFDGTAAGSAGWGPGRARSASRRARVECPRWGEFGARTPK